MEETTILNDKKKKPVSPELQGSGHVRKPSASRKFAEVFLAEDASDAGNFIIWDVLIPIIKDGIGTVLHSTVDALFGPGRGGQYRGGTGRNGNHVNYNKQYESRRGYPEPRERSERVRNSQHGLQDIVISTKSIAEAIIDDLDDDIREYGLVTIGSYYERAIEYMPELSREIETSFNDNKFGWTSMRDVYSQRLMGGGYRIVFPRPKPLD